MEVTNKEAQEFVGEFENARILYSNSGAKRIICETKASYSRLKFLSRKLFLVKTFVKKFVFPIK